MNHDKALEYLSGIFDGIPNADELLQLVELEFIRKDAVQNQQNKVRRSLILLFSLIVGYLLISPPAGKVSKINLRSP